jgi:pullulanase/glycogen debranching enzyme
MTASSDRRRARIGALIGSLSLLTLAACGGGGGGGSTPTPPSPPPPPPPPAVAAATVRVHYERSDALYTGWGVYSWEGPKTLYTDWPSGDKYRFDKTDSYGMYVDIPIDTTVSDMKFLINNAKDPNNVQKAPDCDLSFNFNSDIATAGQEVWVKWDTCQVFASLAATKALGIAHARAIWMQHDTIAWPAVPAAGEYRLYYAANGGIAVNADTGVSGADGFYALTASSSLPSGLKTQFPQYASATALAVPTDAQSQAKSLLRGQLVVVQMSGGKPAAATQLQVQGVLDDLYASAAKPQTLGPSFAGDGTPTLKLWAPTAQQVALNVNGQSVAMTRDDASGVWSVTGQPSWTGAAYYTYTVTAWSWRDNGVGSHTVTDPYAVTLNADLSGGAQQQAMVADLSSAALKPAAWDADAAPAEVAPEDAVLYELHVRDFSATDATVPAATQGKYLAFAQSGSAGMQHLKAMAAAGLTHVHLLPAFDFGSVNEGGCSNVNVTVPSSNAATSSSQQSQVTAARDSDCFNWGYDPKHYGAPEGSYASDPNDGGKRVLEFRQMVQSLHNAGLRVVMDVVYNHTSGNFLDQIVPGYYYRLDANGNIETASCCQDTAPEFAMMEKLMTDTLVRWARDYHVDGFRFDIMGFLPLPALERAEAAVNAAASHPTYFYGEGWNFGPPSNDALFQQARQDNLAGSGIGSFNDRIRDAVRGGGCCDSGSTLVSAQGFANGECYANNDGSACSAGQRSDLQYRQNRIRISMAGLLKDYMLGGVSGSTLGAYASDPQEDINYVSVHDGQTLYDINQYKLPASTTSTQRARAQVVGLAPVLLGEGMPFLHAGDELLRSKSLDANSYNSGDWFNRIDWTATGNGIDVMGLPPAPDNQSNWSVMTPILGNPNVVPTAADIAFTREAVKDLLRVRKSTTMFRLRTGADIKSCVAFPDATSQQDGLVVMTVGDGGTTACGDNAYKRVVVLINAQPTAQSFTMASLAGHALQLHPVQAAGSDAVVKTAGFSSVNGAFSVPGRTAAVFVEN